jgi:hypothetical protein
MGSPTIRQAVMAGAMTGEGEDDFGCRGRWSWGGAGSAEGGDRTGAEYNHKRDLAAGA